MQKTEYLNVIKDLKLAIVQSRYVVARLANHELLNLYFRTGKIITDHINDNDWGSKILDKLSQDLQNELPGLRGFSTGNLKKIRVFYKEWQPFLQISSLTANQLTFDAQTLVIGSTVSNQFNTLFYSLGFSHHYSIISHTKKIDERMFYVAQTAQNFWTVRLLEKNLKDDFFHQSGRLPNNFEQTLPKNMGTKAVHMFKDEYLFDYLNIEDEDDERVLESSIMQNIKKFILSLGNDFAFIGNQFRILIEDEEFFIDLLFFHRKIQSLVAIELKRGKFKAEYAGKMNLYLSALDEYIKQPHENPSIGIILCKEKTNKVVEFAFRDFNKAMGVATYKTSREIPSQFRDFLPNEDELKKLME
jgi:predicted nuclease of restriction endonuclease-like (RecB) superfamily